MQRKHEDLKAPVYFLARFSLSLSLSCVCVCELRPIILEHSLQFKVIIM